MLWRLATVLILLFWAVMTVLLVRRTYFPAETEQVAVPVKLVMQRLAANHPPGGTLQLLQGRQRCGNTSYSLLDYPLKGPRKGYTWQVGGAVENGERNQPESRITWNFSGDFTDDEHWERISLSVRSSSADTTVNVGWRQGQDLPEIEVRKAGALVMDTTQALAQAKGSPMMTGLGGFTSMIPGFGGSPVVSLERLIRVSARQASMPLGGRRRKAFALTFSLMGLYQAKAWVTEAGELVRVDLPQDYRLVDLMVLGLDETVKGR